jgi:hypothetical protein
LLAIRKGCRELQVRGQRKIRCLFTISFAGGAPLPLHYWKCPVIILGSDLSEKDNERERETERGREGEFFNLEKATVSWGVRIQIALMLHPPMMMVWYSCRRDFQ